MEKKKIKTNKILITGLFKQKISSEEKKDKYNQIMTVFEGVKKNLGDSNGFFIETEYNDKKKSF